MAKKKKEKTVKVPVKLLCKLDTSINGCIFTLMASLPTLAKNISDIILEIEKICPEAKKKRIKDSKTI